MLERWKRWRRKYWVIYYLDFLAIQLLLICRYWYKLDCRMSRGCRLWPILPECRRRRLFQ